MDENEQKNNIEQTGATDNKTTEDVKETTPLIDIANQAAKRMEDANKETARLFALQEKRDERVALGGEGGGRVESTIISEEDKKKLQAQEYFKDTALGDAIGKLK